MLNTEELILGKDYCNYFLANPKLYQLIGWEINSEDDAGIIKDKSTNEIRYYWSKNYPENEYYFDKMLIGESAKEIETKYIYAPYIVHIRTEEESKARKDLQKKALILLRASVNDIVVTEDMSWKPNPFLKKEN